MRTRSTRRSGTDPRRDVKAFRSTPAVRAESPTAARRSHCAARNRNRVPLFDVDLFANHPLQNTSPESGIENGKRALGGRRKTPDDGRANAGNLRAIVGKLSVQASERSTIAGKRRAMAFRSKTAAFGWKRARFVRQRASFVRQLARFAFQALVLRLSARVLQLEAEKLPLEASLLTIEGRTLESEAHLLPSQASFLPFEQCRPCEAPATSGVTGRRASLASVAYTSSLSCLWQNAVEHLQTGESSAGQPPSSSRSFPRRTSAGDHVQRLVDRSMT